MRMTLHKPVCFIVLFQVLLEVTPCLSTCPAELLSGLDWPESESGQNVSVRCPPGEPSKAVRLCGADSAWGPVDYTGCSLQSLVDLYAKVSNASNAVSEDLAASVGAMGALTEPASIAYSGQLGLAANILVQAFTKDDLSGLAVDAADTYIRNILVAVDNLLDSENFAAMWSNIHQYQDADLFLRYLEGFENFGDVITAYLDDRGHAPLALQSTTYYQSIYEVVPGARDHVHNFSVYSSKVTIPGTALTKQGSARNTSVATVVFASTILNLFPTQSQNSRIHIDSQNISSLLVSCSVFPAPPTFADSVSIQMKNDQVLPNSTCSFLTYGEPNRVWTEDLKGCQKPVFGEDGTVTCHCTHLTTFAVIGKYNTRGKLPHVLLASMVLYMVLIAATICLLLYANRTFDSDRASIVLCFLITLIAGHITLVTGVYAIDNMDACRAVALLLHYFQLSYSFWMLAQAVQIVLKMTYKTTESGTVAQFLALGWITPLFVVAGTAGLYVTSYGRGNYCALPLGSGISYAIIVPVALIGFTNFVCLFYAFYCYYCLKKTDKKCLGHMSRILPNIRACLIVLPLEICEWVFSALSIEYESALFDICWILSALAMSILILIFYGISSSEVVEEYEKHLGPCCWRSKKSSAVRDSPRPGWRDEISQISQYREASSILRDMDSTATVTGANGTAAADGRGGGGAAVAGCSGINNGGLEVDDVLAHGRELNDVSGSNHLASSLSSSFMLKTKLKVFPLRKSHHQPPSPDSQSPSAPGRPGPDNHR